MTNKEAIKGLKALSKEFSGYKPNEEMFDMAIKALEQKPYEKFESAKDHIYKLAGDYKCWDNRLTEDEAVELCHILEQQPCEDAISRQVAIDATWFEPSYTDPLNVLTEVRDRLKALPSAQPYTDEEIQKMQDIEQAQLDKIHELAYQDGKADAMRWIPCSERLPKESGTYTVTAYNGATNRVTYAKYQKRLKRWELTGARAYWRVLAWCPLPEPYREEEQHG